MSIWTGLAAATLSFALTIGFAAACHGTRPFRRMQRLFAPLLAVPHAAFALGLAFLLAPSGWLLRVLSPWATGYRWPPDIALSPDPYGLNLILALVVKETPFLFLMTLGALAQVPADRTLAVARGLGYGRATAWIKTVLPLVYRQIRLPILAVVAFSVSVVDVALLLTGSTTPTLAILIMRWANDPDLSFQFVAAAGACLQLGLALGAILIWIAGERLVARAGGWWDRGRRAGRGGGARASRRRPDRGAHGRGRCRARRHGALVRRAALAMAGRAAVGMEPRQLGRFLRHGRRAGRDDPDRRAGGGRHRPRPRARLPGSGGSRGPATGHARALAALHALDRSAGGLPLRRARCCFSVSGWRGHGGR